jgi:hypothetical protein
MAKKKAESQPVETPEPVQVDEQVRVALDLRKSSLQDNLKKLLAQKEALNIEIDSISLAITNCDYLLTIPGLKISDIEPDQQ